MSKVKFKLNGAGVRQLLKSSEMRAIVQRHASATANAAGPGYASGVFDAGSRVVGKAYADTWEAKRSNAKNNTLLKALRSSK